jgi:hypothetical protein
MKSVSSHLKISGLVLILSLFRAGGLGISSTAAQTSTQNNPTLQPWTVKKIGPSNLKKSLKVTGQAVNRGCDTLTSTHQGRTAEPGCREVA